MRLRSIRSGTRRLLWAAPLVLSLTGYARTGACEANEEKIGARSAALEGAKAFKEGRWADAIDYFTRAESLVHAPPHLLYIARAQVESGLLVEARENLLAVSREELPGDAPRAFRQAQEDARTELKAVETRMPYVTVTVKGAGSADVAVTQDGNRIPSALIGVPRPVNPGAHAFEATAKGLRGTASVTLKDAERQRVTLELAPAEGVPAPAPAAAAAAAAGTSATPAPAGAADAQGAPPASAPAEADKGGGGMNPLLIGSFVGFGVGAVGLVTGTIFSLGAKSKSDDADALYEKENCKVSCTDSIKSQIQDLDDSSKSKGTLAIVGFVAGGVGVAAGVTLLVLSGSSKKESATAPALHVAVGPSSVLLNGTF